MATTKDEATIEQPVIVAKSVTVNEVKELYQQGYNLYQIAEKVFGFESEDSVARVRQIVGCD